MATHSSVLAWRISGTEEPGGLPSMGSHRVDTTEATQHQQQQQRIPTYLKLSFSIAFSMKLCLFTLRNRLIIFYFRTFCIHLMLPLSNTNRLSKDLECYYLLIVFSLHYLFCNPNISRKLITKQVINKCSLNDKMKFKRPFVHSIFTVNLF